MGSGNKAPDYQDPSIKKMEGGEDALAYAMNMMKNGLPENMKKEWERKFAGNISGQLRSGEQDLKERFAGMGNVPIGAVNDAYTKQRAGANEATSNFYGDVIDKDFNARQQGFGNFSALQGIANAMSNAKNQYGMGKYQIDKENEFSIGDMLGSLAGAGGNIASAGITKGCCFIFMAYYDSSPHPLSKMERGTDSLPWWVRECRDEFAPESTARRNGYIRMSEWLVPLMRPPRHFVPLPLGKGETRSRIIRFLVNTLMVKPMTKWGGWYKKVPGYKRYWYYKPVVLFWFKVWEIYGRSSEKAKVKSEKKETEALPFGFAQD